MKKKLMIISLVIFIVGFLSACGITYSKIPMLKPDGQIATLPTGEAAMMEIDYYRLFYKSSIAFGGKQFSFIYGSDASTELQRNMLVIERLMEYAAKTSGQSQGISMPSSTAASADNTGKQVSTETIIK